MAKAEILRARRLFGTQVRTFRKDRGITQARLAEMVGLSLDMVGRIERGTAAASFDSIVRLSNALEVGIAALFGNIQARPRGERSKRIEDIMTSLGRLDLKDLDRVGRIVAAAVK